MYIRELTFFVCLIQNVSLGAIAYDISWICWKDWLYKNQEVDWDWNVWYTVTFKRKAT
jgi:hypothetical protein